MGRPGRATHSRSRASQKIQPKIRATTAADDLRAAADAMYQRMTQGLKARDFLHREQPRLRSLLREKRAPPSTGVRWQYARRYRLVAEREGIVMAGCGANAGKDKRKAGNVDVREFIEVSSNIDSDALTKELAEELDRALSDHGVTQQQLELCVRV
jgi:hypothetical protein